MFEDLDPKLMLISAVMFLVLIWILNTILYKPLIDFMNKREEGIKEDELKIQQNNSDTSDNEALISKIYADARAQAQAIKNEQIRISKEEASKLVEKKRNFLDEEYKKFADDLNQKKEAFKNDLRKELATCSTAIKANLDRI